MGKSGHNQALKSGKTGDCGATYMFIGYVNNHEGNCYHMWNLVTNQVSKGCNIIFLQRMFYQGETTIR